MIPGQFSVTTHHMLRVCSVLFVFVCLEWLAAPSDARAQQFELAGCKIWIAQAPTADREGENHMKLTGSAKAPVTVECDDTQLVADEMELYKENDRVVARGHVVFTTPANRISAERMEFNTKTKLGTFYEAFGSAMLGDQVDRSMFGTQEPYAYFYGDEIHKLGAKKYKIVRGGFTTCVQPTPRWEVTSGSVTLTLDEYAILRNSILKVKGVPLMYLPIFYYPIQEDDRSTGFLMPIYGNSLYRGQSITNAFFWAISRSQDLTLEHNWFTKTGQGYGGEYRYVGTNGSGGTGRMFFINEHAATFNTAAGTITTPDRRSYQIRANLRQSVGGGTRLTGSVDYFSDVTVQQIYSQNPYDASQRSRSYSFGSTTNWGGFSLTGAYYRSEYLYTQTDRYVDGTSPRLSVSRSATRIGPAYVSGSFTYANLNRIGYSGDTVGYNHSLQRLDGIGGVRLPYPSFAFLTVNSSLTWRGTQYSKSLGPNGEVIPVSTFRKYFEMRSEMIGPSFVKIWHRPNSTAASRIKHLIEPNVEFRRTTAIDTFGRVIKLDRVDYILGGSSQVKYGVDTRVFVKPSGESAASRAIVTASVHQTYYGDPEASQWDGNYSTSFLGRPPSNYSPIAISATVAPTARSTADVRIEYDKQLATLQLLTVGGSLNTTNVVASGTFSKRLLNTRYVFDVNSDNYMSAGTTLRNNSNSLGGTYHLNYDLGRKTLVQQRITAHYAAQCCGIAFEYQVYNYPRFSQFVIPQDRRFNVSFTLAGIGTFSNFLGALAGQPTTTGR